MTTAKKDRLAPKEKYFTLAGVAADRKKFLNIKEKWDEEHSGSGSDDEWDPWEHEFEWQNPLQDLRLLRSGTFTKKIREHR